MVKVEEAVVVVKFLAGKNTTHKETREELNR